MSDESASDASRSGATGDLADQAGTESETQETLLSNDEIDVLAARVFKRAFGAFALLAAIGTGFATYLQYDAKQQYDAFFQESTNKLAAFDVEMESLRREAERLREVTGGLHGEHAKAQADLGAARQELEIAIEDYRDAILKLKEVHVGQGRAIESARILSAVYGDVKDSVEATRSDFGESWLQTQRRIDSLSERVEVVSNTTFVYGGVGVREGHEVPIPDSTLRVHVASIERDGYRGLEIRDHRGQVAWRRRNVASGESGDFEYAGTVYTIVPGVTVERILGADEGWINVFRRAVPQASMTENRNTPDEAPAHPHESLPSVAAPAES